MLSEPEAKRIEDGQRDQVREALGAFLPAIYMYYQIRVLVL
jgi:hypothetical protein